MAFMLPRYLLGCAVQTRKVLVEMPQSCRARLAWKSCSIRNAL